MATRGMFTATELVPLLHERGIKLSASQVHRLVSGTPERLSLQVLSAFCDILGCAPADLVTTTAENAGVRKTDRAERALLAARAPPLCRACDQADAVHLFCAARSAHRSPITAPDPRR